MGEAKGGSEWLSMGLARSHDTRIRKASVSIRPRASAGSAGTWHKALVSSVACASKVHRCSACLRKGGNVAALYRESLLEPGTFEWVCGTSGRRKAPQQLHFKRACRACHNVHCECAAIRERQRLRWYDKYWWKEE
jgi:hypothetical protein